MSRTMARKPGRPSRPAYAFGDNFSGMDFVSTTTGFVLTNNVAGTRILYKTVDGGATWTVASKSSK